MKDLAPPAVGQVRLVQAVQIQDSGVDEFERAVGVAQPDWRGRGVGQMPEPGVAFADTQQGAAQGRADPGHEQTDHDEVTVATPAMALSTPSSPVAVKPTMAQPPPMQTIKAVRAAVHPPANAARLIAGRRIEKLVTSP